MRLVGVQRVSTANRVGRRQPVPDPLLSVPVLLRPPAARGSEIYEHDSTAVSTGRLCTLYDFRGAIIQSLALVVIYSSNL